MDQRTNIIKQYFTQIEANAAYLDIYVVRNAILNAIQESITLFEGVVIDLGCGIKPYKELICSSGKVSSYIGIDFENALDKEYAMGRPEIFWDGVTIPLESQYADVLLATELLEHCAEPEKVLKEIYRVLKPGGKLIFTVPFLWPIHLVPYDEYRYTPFSLERHLANAGFVNSDLKALGGWDASLAQMIGIWFVQRPMRFKRILGPLFTWVVCFLYRKDRSFDKSNIRSDGVMITGLSGIAEKGLGV